MEKAEKKRIKVKYSVQAAYITIFFVFIVLMIGMLNTYPTITSRNAVFSTKQVSMMNQASVISMSLSVLETLNEENVPEAMQLLDVNAFDRVAVTDGRAEVIYDTAVTGNEFGQETSNREMLDALSGKNVFSSAYTGDAFLSRTAMPIVSYGEIIGSVYLYEYDEYQASLIGQVQSRLRNISILTGVVLLIILMLFTRALTHRISELANAIGKVREGHYEYRISPRGADEITTLVEEFNDMTGRIEKTEEMRRRFVSDASHELRTPLASIRLLADSISQNEEMDSATMREFVADIGSEAERLQRMTEKLMSLTKMDGHAPVARERVDIKRVAEKTVHLLAPLAKDKNVTLFTDFAEGCIITAAQDDIYQIIFNLAENAIKYNSFGGNVFINLAASGENAVLTVEDTGIGIPEEDMPHVFSRFYRVDKARSREAGGSGLGLSIVHDAVKLHGGDISVEPRKTVGTRFIVTFPLVHDENEATTEENK